MTPPFAVIEIGDTATLRPVPTGPYIPSVLGTDVLHRPRGSGLTRRREVDFGRLTCCACS
jgi:hypothetical protein